MRKELDFEWPDYSCKNCGKKVGSKPSGPASWGYCDKCRDLVPEELGYDNKA